MTRLYNRHLDFPKKIKKGWFVASVTFLYAVFCVDPNILMGDIVFDFSLFNNDFREEGYFAWFVASVYNYVFSFITFRCATAYVSDKLIKSIFYALTIDAVISLFNTIIFGCYNPIESAVVRNVFVILAMFYAYFILADHDN
jgi:hypothetical protein